MALNPFFLQGTSGEQYLMQDLINEQLKIYGIDVYYMPRKILGTENFSNEVIMSKFDDNFIIEAYLNNFDGYGGQDTNIFTKFGIELKDEISLTISRERWDTFIEPFLEDLKSVDPDETILTSRPREGDVIFFPLGERLFEIKYVEQDKPFYQLGKNYVYELKCELLRLNDSEIIETSIEEIDDSVEDEGYITTISLAGIGITAIGAATTASGGVQTISITNDGYEYTSAPIVSISTAPMGGVNASAVATLNGSGIGTVYLTNTGAGYTEAPTVTFSGGGGAGAAATATISDGVIQSVTISNGGGDYYSAPTITFGSLPTGIGSTTPSLEVLTGTGGTITGVRFINAGAGYTTDPTVTFSSPAVGIGTFQKNETVTGSISGTTARVKKYDEDDQFLEVYINSGNFTDGESIVGSSSSASRIVASYNNDPGQEIEFSQNLDLEEFADDILDFTESNPFGRF